MDGMVEAGLRHLPSIVSEKSFSNSTPSPLSCDDRTPPTLDVIRAQTSTHDDASPYAMPCLDPSDIIQLPTR